MNKKINGKPLELWTAGDLLDYFDECIHDSHRCASVRTYAKDNTDNKTPMCLPHRISIMR